MARPIVPNPGRGDVVQTTFCLPTADRQRLMFAASVSGLTISQWLRWAVHEALDADPAFGRPTPAPAMKRSGRPRKASEATTNE